MIVSTIHKPAKAAWARTHLRVYSESYRLISLPHASLAQASQLLVLSTTRGAHFAAVLVDPDEVFLTVAEEVWEEVANSVVHTAAAGPYRALSLTPALDLATVGYFAPAATLLADAGISIVPQCAYQKDHLLLRAADVTLAVGVLQDLIAACHLVGFTNVRLTFPTAGAAAYNTMEVNA